MDDTKKGHFIARFSAPTVQFMDCGDRISMDLPMCGICRPICYERAAQ